MSDFLTDLFQRVNIITLLEALQKASANRSYSSSPARETGSIGKSSASASRPFSEIIQEASKKYGIDENVITAVIQQESSFNPNATSSCGAMGLMQLMPGTAKSLGVQDPFNAEENIMAGCMYLRQKIDEFGNLPMALAAYNAGSGAVRKYGGIPPYKETQAYVQKITHSIDRLA